MVSVSLHKMSGRKGSRWSQVMLGFVCYLNEVTLFLQCIEESLKGLNGK